MAKLVQMICVTHNPQQVRALAAADGADPGFDRGKMRWREMAAKVDQCRPDVLLVVSADHLHMWFMDNMPAFLIGKAPFLEGPFENEIDDWGLPRHRVAIHGEFARALLDGGLKKGVDFSFSDEFHADHAFTVPLTFMRPQADIPVVPLFANIMAPPLPSPERYHRIGEILRDVIEEHPSNLRVCAIYSGHLSVEVGGPRMALAMQGAGSIDPEFDLRMTELVRNGDVAGVLRDATIERMTQAGHAGGTGFMLFIMALGMARGRRPTLAEAILTKSNSLPFYTWDFHAEPE